MRAARHLKRLDSEHAEIKSMHTAQAARGQGVARAILERLLRVARERGHREVSLETGTAPVFAPARHLYASARIHSLCAVCQLRVEPAQHVHDAPARHRGRQHRVNLTPDRLGTSTGEARARAERAGIGPGRLLARR